MPTAGRECSLDHHPMERMKSAASTAKISPISSASSSASRIKYRIVPLAAAAQGYPVPNALTVSYVIESIALHKIPAINVDNLLLRQFP